MTSLKRIIIFGWERFSRDKSASVSAIAVMMIAISIVTGIFLAQGTSELAIVSLQDSVDVSAYFGHEAVEDEILQAREEVLNLDEVKSVEYVSREEALNRFLEDHKDDDLVLDSLDAVGQNPLPASLNIKTHEPRQYNRVTEFIENSSFASLISSIDFRDRFGTIERVSTVASNIETGVLVLSILAGTIAVLVVFNTIRLTIHFSKEEIEIMRLVGASSWFIRGPFIVQGMVIGILASILTVSIFLGVMYFIPVEVEFLYLGFSISEFFLANIATVFLIQLGTGIGLGVISGLVAIRSHLKV